MATRDLFGNFEMANILKWQVTGGLLFLLHSLLHYE